VNDVNAAACKKLSQRPELLCVGRDMSHRGKGDL
jgi:hypothetical protein